MKNNYTIGVLGGMGTYATIHMFQQYATIFTAEKEWERPRIIIDNRCTMPSRVRAILYNEQVEKLIDEMSESMQQLIHLGCNRIILACNTSHLFLPQIYERMPELEGIVINILDICVNSVIDSGVKEVHLLASEGTIEAHIYQNMLAEKGVQCIEPKTSDYALIRECIEAVKQNKYSDYIKELFVDLMNKRNYCILGCTELPVLFYLCKEDIKSINVFDPVQLALKKLKEEYVDK